MGYLQILRVLAALNTQQDLPCDMKGAIKNGELERTKWTTDPIRLAQVVEVSVGEPETYESN
jgi:hypothetical protein